jgi:hypothetical protein
MTQTGPRGWHPGKVLHRLSSPMPSSYDGGTHSCEAVLSTGSPVDRFYGVEVLEISRSACDLTRLPVPLLDSHSQASIGDVLGKVDHAWIAGGQLIGKLSFAQTPKGRAAEGMVSRGELSALSCGYKVTKWSITDSDGAPVDERHAVWDDDLSFTATKWQILEASLVGVPADAAALVRNCGDGGRDVHDVRARMAARSRMVRAMGRLR